MRARQTKHAALAASAATVQLARAAPDHPMALSLPGFVQSTCTLRYRTLATLRATLPTVHCISSCYPRLCLSLVMDPPGFPPETSLVLPRGSSKTCIYTRWAHYMNTSLALALHPICISAPQPSSESVADPPESPR
ncbi:uncharacterized protein BKA78DRAFT_8750 [Phyllosticta capitalensis]|uniref:uncharacterized protein n=1 Tax=Phyllosticta capitalensis TaxID=121624 RepID=UPI00312DE041